MKNHYIKFYGTPNDLHIAITTFEIVCALNFNTRPLGTYPRKDGCLVEYPASMKEFNQFYRTALKRLWSEPDFNGQMPRIATPV